MSKPINYQIGFRIIALINVVMLPLLVIGLIFIEEQLLPSELNDFINKDQTITGVFELMVVGVIYIIYIASSVGIIFLKTWAKYLFTSALAIIMLSTIYYREPLIGSWLFEFLNDITSILQGAILVYLWSPLWTLVKNKNNN